MPSSIGGSYHSLAGENDVYRSTTVAGNNVGVMDSVKKALSFVSGSPVKEEKLLESKKPIVVNARYGIQDKIY